MSCRRGWKLVLIVVGMSCALGASRAGAQSREACVDLLLDPHASTADKMRACRALAEMERLGVPEQLALARQSLYDAEPVRELARQTLVRAVGEQVAEQMRARARQEDLGIPSDEAGRGAVLRSIKTWDDLPRAVAYLRPASTTLRLGAARAAVRIWNTTKALPKAPKQILGEYATWELLEGLAWAYPDLSKEERRAALALGMAFDVDRAEGVPLLIRAANDDDDADVRARAKEHLDPLMKAGKVDERSAEAVMRMAFDEPFRRPADSAMAERFLGSVKGEEERALVARMAIYRRAQGVERVMELLKGLGQAETTWTAAAALVGNETNWRHREQLARVFTPTYTPQEVKGTMAAALLIEGDAGLRVKAARLAAALPDQIDPPEVLDFVVERNREEEPEFIRALGVDAKTAGRHMVVWLREGTFRQKVIAMGVLRAVGVEGEDVRAELNRVMGLENEEATLAAAELLGRQDVLNRAKVPKLLAELRSDSHTARVLAARQLDELGVEPKEVTAALIRAVDRRDLAARVGLVEAIATGHVGRRNSLDVLKERAERADDVVVRAYARAALREVTAVGVAR